MAAPYCPRQRDGTERGLFVRSDPVETAIDRLGSESELTGSFSEMVITTTNLTFLPIYVDSTSQSEISTPFRRPANEPSSPDL